MSARVLVYQRAAGGQAVTELDGGLRRIVWDQPVKAIVAPVAETLLRSDFFAEALPLDEVRQRFGLTEARILAGVENHHLTVAVHRPVEGDPFPVLVLDRMTREHLDDYTAAGRQKGATP